MRQLPGVAGGVKWRPRDGFLFSPETAYDTCIWGSFGRTSVSADQDNELVEGWERLERISASLKDGKSAEPVTVRELLSWFEAKRRGANIVHIIGIALAKNNLRTEHDFAEAYIDNPIVFHLGGARQYGPLIEDTDPVDNLDDIDIDD